MCQPEKYQTRRRIICSIWASGTNGRISIPKGFCFGLPIKDLCRSLLWIQHEKGDAWGETCRLILAKQRLDVGLPSWSWVGWELSHSVHFHRIETTEDDSYIPPLTIWHHDLQPCVDYPKRHVDPLPSLLNNFSRPFPPDI
jgi:hypothetical protein